MDDKNTCNDDETRRHDAINGDELLPPIDTHRSKPEEGPADETDMSKPPTGHHPGESAEAEHDKKYGPRHMHEELNPVAGGK
jgi:hypothetical protein